MKPEVVIGDCSEHAQSSSLFRAAILSELDRVSRLSLNKKTALRKMLRFVVEATLDGKACALKEYTIATLVFGKAETFDPRMTSLVRTQASKLRDALVKHYSECPAVNGPWLWVPAGSYRAVFDQNPALLAKSASLNDQKVGVPRVAASVRIAPVNVFPPTGNLHEIAQAVVRLQRENFMARKFLAPFPESANVESAANIPDLSLEVEHTIVELDDRLLLTAIITSGPSHLALFGNSVTIPWSGDAGKAIAALSAPLSQFASACASLVGLRAFSTASHVSSEPGGLLWEKHATREVPPVPQGFVGHDHPRSSA